MARILIIEDNAANLQLMTYLLNAFGHSTYMAMDGEAGIEAAVRELPDLVVCDIHLPKADGHEVAARLKKIESLAFVPLVAVTALAMVGDRDKVLASGFDGYLAKPIDPQTFVGQLEAYLGRGAASTEAPIPTAPTTPAPAPAQVPMPHGEAKILIVDDTPVNREILRQTLAPMGYQVYSAQTIAEGLALAQQIRPDLILSDQELSHEDGIDFLRQVRADAQLAETPFFLLSSASFGQLISAQARQFGVTRFIERPIEPPMLLSEIADCLKRVQDESDGKNTRC